MKSPLFRRVLRNPRLLPYCAEGLAELAFCKLLILFFPFRSWNRRRGSFQSETLREDMSARMPLLNAIRRSLEISSRFVPWPSKCLDQALAAQRMAARRGLATTIYYGMVRGEDGKWTAHAWVRCGNQWLIGHQPGVPYTVVGTSTRIPLKTPLSLY